MASKGVLRIKIAGDASNFTRTMQGAIGKFGKFGAAAAKAGLMAAGAFAAVSVKAFADFDQAMTESLAIMGDVSDEMRENMSKAAREIAKTTKFSATEAAESYFFLASAGMDAEQSIAALPQVAAFAQAGMFDMATATDLATDAQSALGLASDDAQENLENLTRVTDVFVKANTLANTSVEQISEAMTNKAGAAMRAVGMEIEEGAAVLAAFADQGVKGAEAGTQFSIVLRDLQTRALGNAEAFEAAGIAVFDAEGELRNMADIISDVEQRLGGMSDAQVKAELATLGFTDKSIASLTTLLGTSEAIREYEGELRAAAGTTQEVADKQMESFKNQMGLIKDRLMDVAITVGGFLAPKILTAFDTMGQAWDMFTAVLAGDKAKVRVARATGEMTGLGEVAVVLAGVYEKVRDRIVTAVDAVKQWWDTNGPTIRAAVRDVAESIVEWWEGTGRDAITNFGQAVSDFWDNDVKPAIEALQTAWTNSEEDLTRIWGNLQDTIEHLGNIFGDVMGATKTTVEGDGGDMVTTFESIIDAIDLVVFAVEGIVSAFETVSDWEDTAFGGLVFEAFTLMTNFSRAIQKVIDDYNELRLLMGGDGRTFGKGGSFGKGSLVPAGLPGLASGGVVTKPTVLVAGEGGEDEAILPLSKLRTMMGGGGGVTEVNINMPPGSDGDDVVRALRRWTSRNGPAPFPTAS